MPAPILVVTGPSGVGKSTVSQLVAAAYDQSVHIRADAFMPLVVRGWIEPSLPEAAHQNEVIGGAVAAAAIQFAEGGYTVLLDGHFFPEGVAALAQVCASRNVTLHYFVLHADRATCLGRAESRKSGAIDVESFARLHDRFEDATEHEWDLIDATVSPIEVAARVLTAFESGGCIVPPAEVEGH